MEIRELLQQLRSKNLLERKRAIRGLTVHGVYAVQSLLPLLSGGYDYVQIAAAEALGLIGNLQAVPALTGMLDGKTYGLTTGEGSAHQYAAILEGAAKALGQIGTNDVVELLVRRLQKKEDAITNGAAALGLGYVQKQPVIDILLNALESTDHHYPRNCIVRSLERINDLQAAPALRKLLRDPSWMVQLRIVHALGTLQDIEAEIDLQEIFVWRQQFFEPISGNPESVIQERIQFRASAARSLALLGTPNSLNVLQAGFSSNDLETQRCAAIGLGFARAPQVFDLLIALLKESQGSYDTLAAEALVYWGEPRATTALKLLIDNVLKNRYASGWDSTYDYIKEILVEIALDN